MSLDDLPTIQVYPNGTPSDAELEAERDVKHLAAVAKWLTQDNCECPPFLCWCNWPIVGEVLG